MLYHKYVVSLQHNNKQTKINIMKQKFELFKQNNVWSDSEDHDETLQAWVIFTNEITEQVEEGHGFHTICFNDIEIIECEVNGEVANIMELDQVWNELNDLALNDFNEL